MSITMDNSPGVSGNVLGTWAYEEGVMLSFIRPCKPQGERVHQVASTGTSWIPVVLR